MLKIKKPLLVAEIGQSHNGSFKNVLKAIKMISKTKVDAIKLQTHIASEESTLDEPFRKSKFLKKKYKNRYNYWKSMEFTFNEWKKISFLIKKTGKLFISSPFSHYALDLLCRVNVDAIKIGSGEFFSDDLIKEVIKKKKFVIISTGLATENEVNKLYNKLRTRNMALLQCTSEYPTKFNRIGTNLINKWKIKYNCPIGISIHTNSISPFIVSICNNADIIEFHFKTNNSKLNPDDSSSLSLKQIKDICKFREDYELLNKTYKKVLTKKQKKYKTYFTKSACLKINKSKNEIINRKDIVFKKPGFGFNSDELKKVIGKKLKKNVSSLRILKKSDIE